MERPWVACSKEPNAPPFHYHCPVHKTVSYLPSPCLVVYCWTTRRPIAECVA